MFAGTPYEHDALGTRPSFDKTTGAMLKAFYSKWYAPNNAILVVTGDLDPQKTLAKIRERFTDLPVIMVTGYGSTDSASDVLKMGANNYISKPFKNQELIDAMSDNFSKWQTREGIRDLPEFGNDER